MYAIQVHINEKYSEVMNILYCLHLLMGQEGIADF
jgi:hypothetical protein